MNLGNYTIQIILYILGSVGFGSLVTMIANRGKNSAEAQKILAEAKKASAESQNVVTDMYGKLFDDLQQRLTQQQDQINSMQQREIEYLKIINQHHDEKKALIEKHALIEAELKHQIKALETKLSNRITKIENNG
jgi:transposase-like protein